ncbi:MAG: hypothetical protein STSR0009_16950 [Methanoregula sp.]
MKIFFLSLVICYLLIGGVYADSCSIIDEQGHSYLIFTSQNMAQISAYTVQLNTSDSGTQILSIKGITPYTVFSNINVNTGFSKVSGFVGDPVELLPLAKSIKLAEIFYTGDLNAISVSVLVLADADNNMLYVDNSIVPQTPLITPTLPIYISNSPQYISPGSEPVSLHIMLSEENAYITPYSTGLQQIVFQSSTQTPQSLLNMNASQSVKAQTTPINMGTLSPQSAGEIGARSLTSNEPTLPDHGKPLPSSVCIPILSTVLAAIVLIKCRN